MGVMFCGFISQIWGQWDPVFDFSAVGVNQGKVVIVLLIVQPFYQKLDEMERFCSALCSSTWFLDAFCKCLEKLSSCQPLPANALASLTEELLGFPTLLSLPLHIELYCATLFLAQLEHLFISFYLLVQSLSHS